MSDRDQLALGAASSPAEAIERLKELIAQAQRGETECVAVRMFKKDGAWEDFVIGGESEDQSADTRKALQESYRVAN